MLEAVTTQPERKQSTRLLLASHGEVSHLGHPRSADVEWKPDIGFIARQLAALHPGQKHVQEMLLCAPKWPLQWGSTSHAGMLAHGQKDTCMQCTHQPVVSQLVAVVSSVCNAGEGQATWSVCASVSGCYSVLSCLQRAGFGSNPASSFAGWMFFFCQKGREASDVHLGARKRIEMLPTRNQASEK
jgi:hypothetical protein